MRALEERREPVEEEPRKRKEKCAKVAAKPVAESGIENTSAWAMPSFVDIAQLKEALASCMQ